MSLDPVGELNRYYCIIEYDWQGYMMISQAIMQFARSERDAAERCSGIMLGRDCAPRRIRVFRGQSMDFEWRRVDNYLAAVGEAIE